MTAGRFADSATLGEAREWLRGQVQGVGAHCPCCTQYAKVYRWKLYSTAVRALVILWRRCGREWGHVPSLHPVLSGNGGGISKVKHWGLAEESPEPREDGGRGGWWRITDRGVAFVTEQATVPRYAYVFDGRCLKLDGEQVSIRDALGDKFNLEELMALDAPVEGTLL